MADGATGPGSAAGGWIDDDHNAAVDRLAGRGVWRYGIGIAVPGRLQPAGRHIVREQPAEDFLRAPLRKQKVAARGRQIIGIAVDAGRGAGIGDGKKVQQCAQLGKRGRAPACTGPGRTGRW